MLKSRALIPVDSSLQRERGKERAGLPSPAASSTCSKQVRPRWEGGGVRPGLVLMSSLYKEETQEKGRSTSPNLPSVFIHLSITYNFEHFLFLSARWWEFKDLLAITEGSALVMNSIFLNFNMGSGRVIKHEFWVTQSLRSQSAFCCPLSLEANLCGTTCYSNALILALYNPNHHEMVKRNWVLPLCRENGTVVFLFPVAPSWSCHAVTPCVPPFPHLTLLPVSLLLLLLLPQYTLSAFDSPVFPNFND